LGLDIFEAPHLHYGSRTRCGGWLLQVLCHAADADPVRELVTSVARKLEQRTGRPVGVRVVGMASSEPGRWKVKMLAAHSFRSDAEEMANDLPVVLFAMTGSVARPGTREHRAWWNELKRLNPGRVLALNEAWAGLGSDSDLWLGAIEQSATSPALASAIDALQRDLPPLANTGVRGEVEAFAFASEAGHDWVAMLRSEHWWELAWHRPMPDGNVETIKADTLGLGPGQVGEPAVKTMYVTDGALVVLLEGDQGTTWRVGGVGAEVTAQPLLGLAQSGLWIVSLRPGLDIEASIGRSRHLFEAEAA